MKYCIVGRIPNVYSDIIEEFDTLAEAKSHMQSIIDPKSSNPWYDDFCEAGGSVWIEDSSGSGY